ncbi:MAG: AAA family ATPase, partial [Candidatus Nanopelagicales bacterium]
MRRYILTGPPGSGKTCLLHALADKGYEVIEEAVTDLILAQQAEHIAVRDHNAAFLEVVVDVQRQRQLEVAKSTARAQVFDRSPLCTLALARYLGLEPELGLTNELQRIIHHQVYRNSVFFVRPLGFCEPTAVRTITYEDSLVFEGIHEQVYLEHGFTLVDVPAANVSNRADFVAALGGVVTLSVLRG